MRLPTERHQPRAITASASRLTREQSNTQKRLLEAWQLRTLSYYDLIPEVRYACQFYARQLSAVRFYPAKLLPNGDIEPIESGPPQELFDRVQDPGGGKSAIQFNYGRLMFSTGEGVLFGDENDVWRFLWRDEVKPYDGDRSIRVNSLKEPVGLPGTAYRFWTPHPRYSDLADSPLRPTLDICEELIILTASVRSTAVTRLTQGILALAAELAPSPSDPGHDEDPEQNIFLSDYMDHVTAAIENPGSPEAAVPFLLEGAFDYMKNAEGIQWIKTHDPATDYMERDLRIEAIKRLALGVDMPPEALLGMTDANHWTAKQVEYDKRVHVQPLAERFAGDLNDAYLRPALREKNYAGADDVVIGVDYSGIALSPDSSADANNAADRGMISDDGYRAMANIPAKYAPSKEEMDRYLAVKLRAPEIIDPSLAPMPPAGPTPGPNGAGDASNGPPPPTNGRTGSRQEARTAAVMGAAALALRHCRARAGARLRRHTAACDDCRYITAGKENVVVASALGENTVGTYANPAELVQGGSRELRALLLELGFLASAADILCTRIEAHAAETLFEQEVGLPPGFASIVEEVSSSALEHQAA